jgi:AraC-like DNA-binding protein
MVAIMLSRANWLNNYLDTLHEMNLLPNNELIDTGLPTFFEDASREYVSIILMGKFLSKIEQRGSFKNISLLVAQRATHRDLTFEYSSRAAFLPILNDRLSLYFQCQPIEWNYAQSWIIKAGKLARVHSNSSTTVPMDGLRYFEWLQYAIVRSIIREFAGLSWNPETIAFQSSFTIDEEISKHFPNTRILVGQKSAYMEFPAEILSLKLTNSQRNWTAGGNDLSRPRIPLGLVDDFTNALKLALRSYLPDYYPRLEVAAAIAGVGARSLQRRLTQIGLTYSQLIGQVRLEAAMELLRDPGRKIIDIAYKVGYGDPSHFTRAFRRGVGASPRTFRQCMIANTTLYDGYFEEAVKGASYSLSVPRLRYRRRAGAAKDMVLLTYSNLPMVQARELSISAETPARYSKPRREAVPWMADSLPERML